MKTLHTKSPCCQGKIHRFGNRRRQCSFCGKTWRIRKKKRGRKHRRINKNLLVKALLERQSLIHQMRSNYSSLAALRQRFRKALIWITQQSREYTFENKLILIADGLWFCFRKQDWVLYLMAIKPVDDSRATLIDPVLLAGKESYENWNYAISTIPTEVRSQIRAFVSDNFRGAKRLANHYQWIHQLCHFHLIAQLQIRRGRRKSIIAGRSIREKIYLNIREALETSDKQYLKVLKTRLKRLVRSPKCPGKMRLITNEFLRSIDWYRTYLLYPKLNLPTTTNTIEATGKIIRQVSRTINSPKALQVWAIAIIRLRDTATCNGRNNQPN